MSFEFCSNYSQKSFEFCKFHQKMYHQTIAIIQTAQKGKTPRKAMYLGVNYKV